MSFHPGPFLAGLALLAGGIASARTQWVNRADNLVLAGWRSRRRIDPDSKYARFRAWSSAVTLGFFGVLFVMAGLGLG